MILIVGGAGQGKLACAFACLHVDDAPVSQDPAVPAPIVSKLEEWLRRHDWDELEPLLEARPDVVLVCREVGCGVSPVDGEERAWRERVGRVCCRLAERADAVIRVCCGIPTILKGTAPWN